MVSAKSLLYLPFMDGRTKNVQDEISQCMLFEDAIVLIMKLENGSNLS